MFVIFAIFVTVGADSFNVYTPSVLFFIECKVFVLS